MHNHFAKVKEAVREESMDRVSWYRDKKALLEKDVATLQADKERLQAEKARIEADLHLALIANQRLRVQVQRNAWSSGQCQYDRSPAAGRRAHNFAQNRQLPFPVQSGGPFQH